MPPPQFQNRRDSGASKRQRSRRQLRIRARVGDNEKRANEGDESGHANLLLTGISGGKEKVSAAHHTFEALSISTAVARSAV